MSSRSSVTVQELNVECEASWMYSDSVLGIFDVKNFILNHLFLESCLCCGQICRCSCVLFCTGMLISS